MAERTLINGRNKTEYATAGEKIRDMIEKTTIACDRAMPRRKNIQGKWEVYWWNSEIANLRAEYIRVKRKYTRPKRTGQV